MGRTSRWERPPAPKDVRWYVRLIGKILICIGLLMFGFVAYQLWGTGIETARAQNRLEDEFAELRSSRVSSTNGPAAPSAPPTSALGVATTSTVAAGSALPGPTPASPSTTAAPVPTTGAPTLATGAPTLANTTVVAGGPINGDSLPAAVAPATTTTLATAAAAGTPVGNEPARLDYGYVVDDGPVGYIRIPSVGIDWTFVQGVDRDDLKQGPGHYPGTPFPGELGNSAIAGHRTTYGAPFDHLPGVEVGEDIVIETLTGTYTYVMTGAEVVGPSDGHVVNTTDTTAATLTLTTCTPRGTASQRYVLYARLDPSRSSPVGAYVEHSGEAVGQLPGDDAAAPPTAGQPAATNPVAPTTSSTQPAELAAPTPTQAGTPPPVGTAQSSSAPSPGVGGTPVPATSVAGVAGTATVESSTPAASAGDGPVGSDTASDPLGGQAPQDVEAFANHWFDDEAAWPHVAGWAAFATSVVLAGYLLARRFRNSWIGFAAGVAPFLVTLYFFYQNVNRLLPAAL